MTTPLLTILIPTYRRPKLLERAILSALTQTRTDFQVSVFDNASGDETADVVNRMMDKDSRVKYFCHPENVGMLGNFTAAIRSVETPYFSYLCDDDLVLPNFFETTLAGFEKYPDAMSSSGTIIFTDNEGSFASYGPSIEGDEYLPVPASLLAWRHETKPLITANLFRREVIAGVGLDINGMVSDFEMEIDIAARYPIVVNKTPCAIVVSHSEASTKAGETKFDQWWQLREKLTGKIALVDGLSQEARDKVSETMRHDFGLAIFRAGMGAVSSRNFETATQAAILLRDRYNLPQQAQLLERSTQLARLGPLHSAYQFALSTRRKLKSMRSQSLRNSVRKYLENPSGSIQIDRQG